MARRWESKFLAALENTANVMVAAETAGITRQAAYNYRRDSEDFAAQWDAALEMGISTLEDEAVRRARDGVEKPLVSGGKVIGKVREYSDTLLIFLLKTRRPAIYNPPTRQEHSGPDGKPIALRVTGLEHLSDDELEELLK